MEKVIVWLNANGGVGVTVPMMGVRGAAVIKPASFKIEGDEVILIPAETRPETDAEFAQWIGERDLPKGTVFRVVDASDVPPLNIDTAEQDEATRVKWFNKLTGGADGMAIGPDDYDAAITYCLAMRENELNAELSSLLDGKAVVA